MDLDYRRIGGRAGDALTDFEMALTVVATVVSVAADRAMVDAGLKAFSTDKPFPPEAVERPGVAYGFAGDEHGRLTITDPSRPPRLGERIEFFPPHCDPTVNLYDRVCGPRATRWTRSGRSPRAAARTSGATAHGRVADWTERDHPRRQRDGRADRAARATAEAFEQGRRPKRSCSGSCTGSGTRHLQAEAQPIVESLRAPANQSPSQRRRYGLSMLLNDTRDARALTMPLTILRDAG